MEIREGVWTPDEEIPEALLEDEQERKLFYQIKNTKTALERFEDPQTEIDDCLYAFQKQYLLKQKARIEQNITEALAPPENWEQLKELQSQRNEIRKLLKNLKNLTPTQATLAN